MYKKLLRRRLTTDATLADLIAQRVYAVGEVPQNATYPFVVVEETAQVESARDTAHADELRANTVAVHCMAASYTEADTLGRLVRTRLNGWRETYLPFGERILGFFIEDMQDATVRRAAKGESPIHDAVLVCKVWHFE